MHIESEAGQPAPTCCRSRDGQQNALPIRPFSSTRPSPRLPFWSAFCNYPPFSAASFSNGFRMQKAAAISLRHQGHLHTSDHVPCLSNLRLHKVFVILVKTIMYGPTDFTHQPPANEQPRHAQPLNCSRILKEMSPKAHILPNKHMLPYLRFRCNRGRRSRLTRSVEPCKITLQR
jgi:hypothetical protein